MRGKDEQQVSVFSYVSAEERIPQEHPLRTIRRTVDGVLKGMSKEFDALYASSGRQSIPPERLLRALLLQMFYSIRSERMLIEQLNSVGCSAGLSVWTWTSRYGITRCLAKTASDC